MPYEIEKIYLLPVMSNDIFLLKKKKKLELLNFNFAEVVLIFINLTF